MAEKALTVDEKTARQLISMIKGKNISQLSVTQGDTHITVKQKPGQARVIIPAQLPAISPQEDPAEKEKVIPGQKHQDEQTVSGTIVRSELVGILHLTLDGKLLVKEGSVFEKGKTIAVINAMKINNDVKAQLKCTVIKVLAKDNSIVEYGTPLFEIVPS